MTTETEGAADAVTEDVVADLAATETDQSGDDAAAATDEGEVPQPKPKKSAQERINEITAKAREAEREAEYWRSRATNPQPAPAQQQPAGDGKPDPQSYAEGAYDPQFIEDLTDWKANAAAARLLSQHQAQTRTQTAIESFEAKVAADYPEGEPAGITALRRAPPHLVPQTLVDIITASDVGPKLAEHLGDNPRELHRLSALPPHLQGRALAQLEAKLAAPAVTPPKTATDAPEPAPTLRGAGGKFKVNPDTSDFSAFDKAY